MHRGEHAGAVRGASQVEQGLAVARHEGVEVHEPGDPLGGAVGDDGRDHAAVAVADQHHVAQVLEVQHGQDVGDMRLEVELGTCEVAALAEAGVGRREELVTSLAQQRAHLLPGPARRPGAVRHEKSRHRIRLRGCRDDVSVRASPANGGRATP
jgi:hypothetical protein